MQKIGMIFMSRTFWTLVVMFIINGINGVHNAIPAGAIPYVDSVLGLLATYFHVNPSQNYNS